MSKLSRKIAVTMASIAVAIMTNVSVTICSKCEVGYMPSAISKSDNAPICMPTKSFNGCSTIPTSIADHVFVDDLASSIELSDEQVQQEDCNPDDKRCLSARSGHPTAATAGLQHLHKDAQQPRDVLSSGLVRLANAILHQAFD